MSDSRWSRWTLCGDDVAAGRKPAVGRWRVDPPGCRPACAWRSRTWPSLRLPCAPRPSAGWRHSTAGRRRLLRWTQAIASGATDAGQRQQAATEQFVALQREVLLSGPYLDFDRLLIVRRSANQLGLPQNWQGNCALPGAATTMKSPCSRRCAPALSADSCSSRPTAPSWATSICMPMRTRCSSLRSEPMTVGRSSRCSPTARGCGR